MYLKYIRIYTSIFHLNHFSSQSSEECCNFARRGIYPQHFSNLLQGDSILTFSNLKKISTYRALPSYKSTLNYYSMLLFRQTVNEMFHCETHITMTIDEHLPNQQNTVNLVFNMLEPVLFVLSFSFSHTQATSRVTTGQGDVLQHVC